MVKKVAIRLGVNPSDKVEVIRDFGDMEAKAKSSFGGIGAAASAANERLREQKTRIDAIKQAAASPVAGALATFSGVNFDPVKSARASASVFSSLLAEQERDARTLQAALDPLAAALDRYNAAVERAASLKSYGKISESEYRAEVERATTALTAQKAVLEQQEAVLQQQIAALRTVAATPSPVQARIDATTGVTTASSGNNANAAEYEALLAAQEKQAYALRTVLDPMGAAQERYNAAVARSNQLLAYNKISETEHAKALKLARTEFETFEKSQISSRGSQLTTFQLQNLSYQLNDVVTGFLSGQHAGQIFAQQGGQIIQVFGGSGGVQKVLQSVTAFAISPLGLALEATTAFMITGAVAAYSYSKSISDLNLSLKGVGATAGLTGEQLKTLADQSGAAGGQANAAAEAQAAGLVRAGVTSTDVIKGAIESVKGYAVVTGKDMPAATQALTQALVDPVSGVKSLNAELLLWNAAQQDNIIKMAQSGDIIGAQRAIIDALSGNIARSKDEVYGWAGAWEQLKINISNAWTELGRDINPSPSDRLKRYEQDRAGRFATGRALNPYAPDVEQYAKSGQLVKDIASFWRDQNAAAAKEKPAKDNRDSLLLKGALDTLDPVTGQRNRIQGAFDLVNAQFKNGTATAAQLAAAQKAYNNQIAALDRRENPKVPGADRAARLAREAEAMEVNTRESLKLAEAYLTGDAAAIKAEATRKALTDATKKGTDAEAAVRRQIALTIAEQAAQSARNIAAMRDETGVQASVNAQVQAGTLSYKDMADQRALEQAQLPIVTLMTLADADAKKVLQAELDALTKAYADNSAERKRAALLTDTGQLEDDIALQQRQLDLMRASNAERTLALAQFQAARKIRDDLPNLDINNPDADFAAAVDYGVKSDKKAQGDNVTDLAKYRADVEKSQGRDIEAARLQLSLASANDNQRDLAAQKLKVIQDLIERGATAQEAENDAAVRNLDILNEINRTYEQRKAYSDEIKALGEKEIDRFGDLLKKGSRDWSEWRDAAKDAIRDIGAELIQLAILNPLKNLVLGQNNPTLGSSTKSSGGSEGNSAGLISTILSFVGFAGGTENAPPGWAWVGEDGPELRKLRAGDVIKTNAVSQQMAKAVTGGAGAMVSGGGVTILQPHFNDFTGAVVTQDLIDEFEKKSQKSAAEAATVAGTQAYNQAMQDMPATLMRYQMNKR